MSGSVLVSLLLDEDSDEDRFALVTSLVGLLVSCSGGGLFSASASVLVSSLLDEDVDEDRFVVFRRGRFGEDVGVDWSGGE